MECLRCSHRQQDEVKRKLFLVQYALFIINHWRPGMDIALARTFLEIVASGNFVRAAERLHVTQTTVSVRVQTLEGLLGRKLFVRNKAGASLTPAGEQFMRYAPLLVQVWERARH